MEHFKVHINLLCMCFCTIPSNGHTSLSTALVSAPDHELSEQLFACRAESDGNTNYDIHYMGIGN